MDYHSILISNLSQTTQSHHLLIHTACIRNCILNEAGTCTRTRAFQTCRATPAANPPKVGRREKKCSMPNLLHKDWERQGKKNNGTLQM